MNAAIWCRVSTDDQSNLNQLGALRSWAERRGLTVVNEYRVEESAWTGKHRAALATAVEDARLGQYEVLLVWALDRLSREGIEATLSTMRAFRERGVRVLSLQEAWTDGPEAMQELLGAFFAWMAQQESERRSERVRAGLARRKASGLPIGRLQGAKDKVPRRRAGYYARHEAHRT